MNLKTLPHKNLLLSGVFALSMFLFALYLENGQNFSFNFKSSKQLASALPVALNESTDIDTDKDGLADWKERLYGSDIHNPDTDGDGTKDGEEVRLGRNPVVPNTAPLGSGPTDKLASSENKHYATSTTDTHGLKKEFFEKYLSEGSRNIRETTFRDLIKKVDVKKIAPAKREMVSLNVSSDNNNTGVKTYVNAFGTTVKKYLAFRMKESEDALLKKAMGKMGVGTRDELQLVAINYKNFAKDLLVLRVPSKLAQAHLLIVNGYQGMSDGMLGLQKMQSAPMDGAASYELYMKSRIDVVNGYAMIVALIGDERIAFEAKEPGYMFYENTLPDKTPVKKITRP